MLNKNTKKFLNNQNWFNYYTIQKTSQLVISFKKHGNLGNK